MRTAVILLVVAVACVAGIAVDIKPCDGVSADVCTVKEVRIDPCTNKKRCRLRKGAPATLAFDFVPNFSASKLKTGAFGVVQGLDQPFSELQNADGCQYTSCPIEAGQEKQYSYGLHLGTKLPSGKFTFKWKVWDEANEANVCCFTTDVELRRGKGRK